MPVLALSFCFGAAVRLGWRVPLPAFIYLFLISLAALLLFQRTRLLPVTACLLAASAGGVRTDAWLGTPADSVSRLAGRKWVLLTGSVVSEPAVKPWGVLFDMNVTRADTFRGPESASGRVRVSAPLAQKARPRYGREVTVFGRLRLPDDASNPGELPPAQYLKRDGITATVRAEDIRPTGRTGGNPFIAASLASRRHMERGIRATLPQTQAGLLAALLFSDVSALPERLQQDFARAGTVHVLSTSGLHVALLAGLMTLLLPARNPKHRRMRSGIFVVVLIFFALMTGLRPAVLRAVLMTGAVLAAPLFDREPDTWCAISLAALCLVAASPGNLLDPGFQLSFSAVICLALWFGRRSHGSVPRWKAWLRDSVQTSVVASAATAPLTVRYFGTLSLASPLSNLLVVPLLAPVMGLGLLQGFLWPYLRGPAMILGQLNERLLNAMLVMTEAIGRSRWSALDTGMVSPAATAVLLGCVAVGLTAWRFWPESGVLRGRRPMAVWSAVGLAAIGIGFFALLGPQPPLKVTFLDVGQGDSALIQTPGGHNILIDAGGRDEYNEYKVEEPSDTGRRIVLPALKRAGVHKLDAVVLSHPHEDHAGGLADVFEALPVSLWLDTGQEHDSPGYVTASLAASRQSLPRKNVRSGMSMHLDNGISLYFTAPSYPFLLGTGDDLNNNSAVCRLTYGSTSFLFCGDAEAEEESRLLAEGRTPRSDVMKAGHHGGASSCTEDFLGSVRPRWVVISCGRGNMYGHPARESLLRFDDAGAAVLRTDISGGIVFTSDGRTLKVSTSRWSLP